ncbi:radiation-inducible immediate-early gene IEX-1 [Rhinophrynus dorsalis]
MCVQSGKRPRQRPVLPALTVPDSGSDSETCPRVPLHRPGRSRLPEIFTFDVESVQPVAAPRRHPAGGRGRRPRRVLYPAKVRRYLPPPETDRALRWLYVLCLVVLVQIFSEDGSLAEGEVLPPAAGVQDKILLPAAGVQDKILLPAAGVQDIIMPPAAMAHNGHVLPASMVQQGNLSAVHTQTPTASHRQITHRNMTTCFIHYTLLQIQR